MIGTPFSLSKKLRTRSYDFSVSPELLLINVSILKYFGFLSFEHFISFTSPETKSKSAESMFVPGKIVLSSEGKLLQFSLDTDPQLEQTKRLAPRWMTQVGALGPFSAKILLLLSILRM